jgi:hypothetical protein
MGAALVGRLALRVTCRTQRRCDDQRRSRYGLDWAAWVSRAKVWVRTRPATRAQGRGTGGQARAARPRAVRGSADRSSGRVFYGCPMSAAWGVEGPGCLLANFDLLGQHQAILSALEL